MFYLISSGDIPALTFFRCKLKVFSAIWAMKYLFSISDKTYCNLRLHRNSQDAKLVLKHLFRGLIYLCRILLTRPNTPYGDINPYGNKKAYTLPIKHAYSNILKILTPKMKIFRIKKSDIFLIFAQKHRL